MKHPNVAFNQKNLEATLCRNLGGVSECDTIVINTNCRSVTICQMFYYIIRMLCVKKRVNSYIMLL